MTAKRTPPTKPAKKSAGKGKAAPVKTKKAAPITKRPVGRPSSYKPEYANLAYRFCLLGATDKQMAESFGVTEKTLNAWKAEVPEFLQSMLEGKEKADSVIAESLFHRAKGYSHPEVDIRVVDHTIVQTKLTKHYPPDTQAASLWLRNRQPKLWRDKVEQEISGPNGGPIQTESTVTFSPAEAYQRLLGGGT